MEQELNYEYLKGLYSGPEVWPFDSGMCHCGGLTYISSVEEEKGIDSITWKCCRCKEERIYYYSVS